MYIIYAIGMYMRLWRWSSCKI